MRADIYKLRSRKVSQPYKERNFSTSSGKPNLGKPNWSGNARERLYRRFLEIEAETNVRRLRQGYSHTTKLTIIFIMALLAEIIEYLFTIEDKY